MIVSFHLSLLRMRKQWENRNGNIFQFFIVVVVVVVIIRPGTHVLHTTDEQLRFSIQVHPCNVLDRPQENLRFSRVDCNALGRWQRTKTESDKTEKWRIFFPTCSHPFAITFSLCSSFRFFPKFSVFFSSFFFSVSFRRYFICNSNYLRSANIINCISKSGKTGKIVCNHKNSRHTHLRDCIMMEIRTLMTCH